MSEVLGGGLAHERDIAGEQPHRLLGPRRPQVDLSFDHYVDRERRPAAEAQPPVAVGGGAREGRAAGARALKQIGQYVHRARR